MTRSLTGALLVLSVVTLTAQQRTPADALDSLDAAVQELRTMLTPPPCTFAVTAPDAAPIAAAGGSVAVPVLPSASTCAWTVTLADAWTTANRTGATGPATVTISVAPNTALTSRSTVVQVAGVALPVAQRAADPTPPTPSTLITTSEELTGALKVGGAIRLAPGTFTGPFVVSVDCLLYTSPSPRD